MLGLSNITEKIAEKAIQWQSRLLEPVYPIIFFDAIFYKVREDGKVKPKAAIKNYILFAKKLFDQKLKKVRDDYKLNDFSNKIINHKSLANKSSLLKKVNEL